MATAKTPYDNRDRLSRKRTPGARDVRSRAPEVYYTYDRHGEVVELTSRELEVRVAQSQMVLPIGNERHG